MKMLPITNYYEVEDDRQQIIGISIKEIQITMTINDEACAEITDDRSQSVRIADNKATVM